MASPNTQQWIFIKEYAKDMNGTRAAEVAKYRSPDKTAPRLLKLPHVLEAINKELVNSAILAGPTIPRILQELMRIAFFDPAELFHDDGTPKALSEINENTRRCIAGIEFAMEGRGEDAVTIKKYKIADKHKALENLGRHLAMFTDKMKLDVNTELEQMTDEQLTNTIEQFAKAAGFSLAATAKGETQH